MEKETLKAIQASADKAIQFFDDLEFVLTGKRQSEETKRYGRLLFLNGFTQGALNAHTISKN